MEAVDLADLVQGHMESCCGYGNELWGSYNAGNLLSPWRSICVLRWVMFLGVS